MQEDAFSLPVTANNFKAAAVARQAGRLLVASGSYKEALEQFEHACLIERHNHKNFELCAYAMIHLGPRSLGEAKGKLMRAVEIAPFSAWVRMLNASLAKAKAGVEDLTIDSDINLLSQLFVAYDEAWKLDPKIRGAAECRQNVEKLLKQLNAELPSFKNGISAEASEARAAGVIALTKKKYAEAFKRIDLCLSLEPGNPQNHTLRAKALCKLKRAKGETFQFAIRDAIYAIKAVHGADGDAWGALALAYTRTGDLDWAQEAWEICAQQAPQLFHETYEKDAEKLTKAIHKKGKHFVHRAVPWRFDETVVAPVAGSDESRAEPMLEVDSLGKMTVRSQMKRVLQSGHQRPHLDLSPRAGTGAASGVSPRFGKDAPVKSGAKLDPSSATGGAGRSPRPGNAKLSPGRAGGVKVDADLDRFCKLIKGRVSRREAALMTESDIPASLSLPDKLFMRGFVASLQSK